MNKKISSSFGIIVVFIMFFGLFAFTFAPSSAKADFWDDFVDFLNPVEHVKNIIDGDLLDNLPPLPDFGDNDSTTKIYINNQTPNPTVNISSNPNSISYGQSSTISWSSNYATSCFASGGTNGWSGNKNTSGTFFTGALTNTITFNITCSNSTGQAFASTTVNVDTQVQNPTVQLTASPTSVSEGQGSTLSWNSGNATFCNASGGTNSWAGTRNTSGTFFTGSLTNTITFSISCNNNNGGQAFDSVTIFVDEDDNDNDVPSVSLQADDTNIDFEDDTTLRWSSSNADFCHASGGDNGWSGNKSRSGTFNTGELTDTTTFRITCTNENGSDDDSVTIRVNDNDDEDNNNDDEPDVTTRNATNISSGSATLNGRVDGNGSSARAWFEYGTNTNLGYSTSQNSYGSGSTNYNRSISGLIPNTTYYFRAVAENSQDTVYGSILSFNTGNIFVNNTISNQPTVIISADLMDIAFNGATNIRWFTTDATSCFASGGSVGWAGAKNTGSGSFFTGALISSRTYIITCSNNVGSSTDSVTVNVRGQVLGTTTTIVRPPAPLTSLVLINSSVNSNQPIMSTIDNIRPRPGDEINYTVSYQNIGTGAITGVILQIALPQEVNYIFSSKSNPSVFGSTLIFNLGTLRANGQDSVTVRVRVKDNTLSGTILNFPAILSYVDPIGLPQSITSNATAQVWSEPVIVNGSLGANVIGAGFLPTNLFGWLLLLVLVLTLVLLAKYLLVPDYSLSFRKQIVTTLDEPLGKKTTTTIHE